MGTAFSLFLTAVVLLAAGLATYTFASRAIDTSRRAHLERFRFPSGVRRKVHQRYPHLAEHDLDRVMQALTLWFDLSRRARGRPLAMPSQVVDVAWHEFILFTRNYRHFCRQALGRFLHHTPAEAMRTPTEAQEGIRRAWRLSCARERIDPRHPARLPLLFALDAELRIPDGFRYSLDCAHALDARNAAGGSYCASHIGCGSDGGPGGCSSDSGCSGSSGDGGSGGDGGCGGGGD